MQDKIHSTLRDIVSQYPSISLQLVAGQTSYNLHDGMMDDIPRLAFHLEMITRFVPEGGRIADIGGGFTPLAHALVVLGFQGVLIDDFGDQWHGATADILENQRQCGVTIISCDVLGDWNLEEESLDAVMSFDCMEHLHHSPKLLFKKLMAALKPGGVFFLGVPNCVNLRKRITIPFGVGKWSQIEEWYEEKVFRGHVREPDVDDLCYIARSLNLQEVKIIGKNWLGYNSRFSFVRWLTPFADATLQRMPGLCSNIYLIGRKAL